MSVTAELVIKAVDKASSVFKIVNKAIDDMVKAINVINLKPLVAALDGATKKADDIKKALEDLSAKAEPALKAVETATEDMDKALDESKKSAEEAGKGFESLGTKIKEGLSVVSEVGSAAQEVGKKFAEIGEAGLGFFEEAVTAAAGFEKALTKSMSASDATGAKFNLLKGQVGELAEELSIKFGMSVEDVLNAMYHVQSMGIEPTDKGFRDLSESALKLTKIYGIDLEKSTRSIGVTTSIFGQEMSTAGHTANVLFGASQKGKTTVEELMKALNEGGKAADAMGISMEDSAALLVAFSDKGNMGAQAGTVMRNSLLRLAAPPKDAAEALSILGVKVYDGGLKMRDASKVIDDFGKEFKKLPPAEQKTIMQTLGVDSEVSKTKVRAFHTVMWELGEKLRYMDDTKSAEIIKRLGVDASGSTSKVATFADKVKAVADKLKDAKGVEADQIFNKLHISSDKAAGALGNTHKTSVLVAKALRDMKDTEANKLFTELGISTDTLKTKQKPLAEMIKEVGKSIDGNKGPTKEQQKVFTELGITWEKTSTKAKPIKDALGEIKEKMKQGFTPEMINFLNQYGIAMFTGAGKMRPMWTILKELKEATGKLSDEERNRLTKMLAGQRAFAAFSELLKGDLKTYEKLGQTLKEQEKLDKAWADAQKTLAVQAEKLKAVWHGFMVTVGTPLVKVLTPIVEKIVEWADGVRKFLAHNPELTKNIAIWGALGAALAVAFGTIMTVVGGAIVGISAFITGLIAMKATAVIVGAGVAVIGAAITIVMGIAAAFAMAWKTNWGNIRTITNDAIAFIKPLISTFLEEAKKLFDEVIAIVGPLWEELWTAVGDAIKEAYAAIKPYMPQIKELLIGGLKAIAQFIKMDFLVAWALIEPAVSTSIKVIKLLAKAFKENEDAIKLCAITIEKSIKTMETVVLVVLKGIAIELDRLTLGAFGALTRKLKEILDYIDKIKKAQALAQSISNSMTAATKPPSISGGTSGDAGTGGSTGTGSAGGGGSLKKTIIIQGNVYGGPAGARELDSILNRAANERLARGMI